MHVEDLFGPPGELEKGGGDDLVKGELAIFFEAPIEKKRTVVKCCPCLAPKKHWKLLKIHDIMRILLSNQKHPANTLPNPNPNPANPKIHITTRGSPKNPAQTAYPTLQVNVGQNLSYLFFGCLPHSTTSLFHTGRLGSLTHSQVSSRYFSTCSRLKTARGSNSSSP